MPEVTCCGLVMANEQDSRVAVVHGCFSEGGDSVLSVFSLKRLDAKLAIYAGGVSKYIIIITRNELASLAHSFYTCLNFQTSTHASIVLLSSKAPKRRRLE